MTTSVCFYLGTPWRIYSGHGPSRRHLTISRPRRCRCDQTTPTHAVGNANLGPDTAGRHLTTHRRVDVVDEGAAAASGCNGTLGGFCLGLVDVELSAPERGIWPTIALAKHPQMTTKAVPALCNFQFQLVQGTRPGAERPPDFQRRKGTDQRAPTSVTEGLHRPARGGNRTAGGTLLEVAWDGSFHPFI